jgi:hypothetical protein
MKNSNDNKLRQLVESNDLKGIKNYLITHTKASILQKDKDGRNALYYALFNGDVEIIRVLVEYGFNPIDIDNQTGATALHLAASEGNFDLVVYLVVSVKMNVNVLDKNGRNPLYYAMMFLNKNNTNKDLVVSPAHLDIAWLLIGYGGKFQPDMFGMQLELETIERMLLDYIHKGIKTIDCDHHAQHSNYISFLKATLNYYYLFYKDIRNTPFHRWFKNIHACYIANTPAHTARKIRTIICKCFKL